MSEIPYNAAIDPVATEKAKKTMKAFLAPNADRPLLIKVRGECPRCKHEIDGKHWLVVVAGAVASTDAEQFEALAPVIDKLDVDLSTGDEEFDVQCNCGRDHPQHPENVLNCGCRFKMRVTWPSVAATP